MRQVGWSVGQTTHRLKIFIIAARRVSGIRSKQRNSLTVGSGLVHLEAVHIAQYQGRILRSLYKSSKGVSPCPTRVLPGFVQYDRRVHPALEGGSDPRLLRTAYGKQRAPSRAVWRADE
jgi:hypothetical protein